jgi:hypothetical protein
MASHSSYPWLLAFRSREALRSWSVSFLAVRDAAALYMALVPDNAPEEAYQCVQSGIVALRKLGGQRRIHTGVALYRSAGYAHRAQMMAHP